MDKSILETKQPLLVALGFLCRLYVTTALFWLGFRFLDHYVYSGRFTTVLMRFAGVWLIFLSIHLFLNFRSKKISEHAYSIWVIVLAGVVILACLYYFLNFPDPEAGVSFGILKEIFFIQ